MKKFTLNDKEFTCPESWEEVKLRQYVRVAKLEEDKTEFILGELYLLKLIEALCDAEGGELDDLTVDIVGDLSVAVGFLQTEFKWSTIKKIDIEGVTYVFPNDLNKLTIGEYISIKTFQEASKSQAEALPSILAIILRPGHLVKNEETGKEEWVQDKFKTDNLEWRKNLFMELPVTELMGPITFFLSGKKS
jgi:hypothetical protein